MNNRPMKWEENYEIAKYYDVGNDKINRTIVTFINLILVQLFILNASHTWLKVTT